MKDLPANLLIQKNLLKSDAAWLLLLDVTLPNTTELRFVRNHANVTRFKDDYTNSNIERHYKCNDDEPNTVVTDDGPNASNATLAGGDNTEDISVTGQTNNAFDMDGAADYINVNSTLQSVLSDSFSVSLWIKPDDGRPPSSRNMAGTDDISGNNSGVALQVVSTGKIGFAYKANGNMGTTALTQVSYFEDGPATEFTHIVCVADSTIGGVGGKKIYVNGQEAALDVSLDGSTAGVTFADYSSDENLFIGALNYDGSPSNYIDAKIDNVMIFSKALTSDEVEELYNDGTGTELMPFTYTGANFELDMTTDEGQGRIPQWQLRVANVARVLESYLEAQGGAVGSTVVVTVVNSKYLAEDYSELEKIFEVLDCVSDAQWVTFTLGAPNPLRQRFPLRRWIANHCGWHFSWGGGECSYASYSVADLSFGAGTEEVIVTVNSLSFEDGRDILLTGCTGITPSIAGIWAASYLDVNRYELMTSDSSDYSGSYGGDGTAGWNDCKRNLADCRQHFNETRFGGAPGLRSGGVRFA